MLTPVKRKLRVGWFDQSSPASEALLAQERAEAQDWGDASIADDSEWVWLARSSLAARFIGSTSTPPWVGKYKRHARRLWYRQTT